MDILLNYTERRRKQLERMESIDRDLKNLNCHEAVVNYLLWARYQNKLQFEEFNKSHFWEKKSKLEKEMIFMDNHLETMSKRLQEEDPCVVLESQIFWR